MGWKDTACFYGDAETFVSNRFSARERYLLKRLEATGRGQFALVDAAGSDASTLEEELKSSGDSCGFAFWVPSSESPKSDEDFLLPMSPPPSLLSLPSILVDAEKYRYSSPPPLKRQLLQCRTRARARELFDLLCKVCPCDGLLGVGASRSKPSCLPDELDEKLSLDYIPILKVMGQSELAVDTSTQCGDREFHPYQRSTRTSAKRRSHYYEKLNTALKWDVDNLSAHEVGMRLAESLIQY